MNKFDFSSFAFKENGQQSTSIELPAKIQSKSKLKLDDSDEQEVKGLRTKSGRTIKLIKDVKNNETLTESSGSESEDENDEDAFKVSEYTQRKYSSNLFKSKKQRPVRNSKLVEEDDEEIIEKPRPRKVIYPSDSDDEHDISAKFRPLKKANRSITVNYNKKSSLAKPLKMLNNKLAKTQLKEEPKKNLSLPDEINLLLEDESNESVKNTKKRRISPISEDEDSDFTATPAKKRSKKKNNILFSDDESNSKQDSSFVNDDKEEADDCPDDIQVILEDQEDDEDYESDENIFSSSDDDNEEANGKGTKIVEKEKKIFLKESLVKLCNEGKEAEFMSVTSFNKKIYQELISLREFRDWSDLFNKFEKSTILSTDTIERLSEYIKTKNVITDIMDKCQELSNRIRESVKNLKENREPKCLNNKLKLKNYQLVGLNYLVLMFKQGLNGILADEMGLGKTIQVIALIAYLREECNIFGTHLIVVPSSILTNWEREFQLWCPRIKVLKYYGNQEERTQLRYDIVSKSVPFDVILTTYNMLYSADDKKLLTRVKFQYAVFDEAHMLKNMKSSRFKNLFAVKAKYRLMLTGTPIQNNLLELISLLTFTVPNLFYSKLNFMENFFKNKKFEDNKSEFVQEKTDQAKEILKPFILRRIKENVLKDLPSKIEQYVTLEMTKNQAELYEKIVSKYSEQVKERKERKEREKREKLRGKIEIIEDRNRRRKKTDYNEENLFFIEELDKSKKRGKQTNLKFSPVKEPKLKDQIIDISSDTSNSDIFFLEDSENAKKDNKTINERKGSILMELRKCSNHPLLIRNLYTDDLLIKMAKILKKKEPYYQKDGNIDYMVEDMQILNDFDLHMLCKKFPSIDTFKLDDSKILESNKFKYLDQALAEFREKNQKVLIFSQFVMMLDIIEEYLNIKSIKYCRLDGSTKVTERMVKIDDFKDREKFVFLLTTKAGGVGINLVEANNVIIHDSDWNPYNDIQAQARAHRIGQTQEVNIYKLISDKTVEVYMKEICEEKLTVGKRITSDEIEKVKKDEELTDVKKLLKKALNI